MTSSADPNHHDNISHEESQQQHLAVILFYKYLDPRSSRSSWLLNHFPDFYLEKLLDFQRHLCFRLGLKGRILLASEGINGTLSGASLEVLKAYQSEMEQFDLIHHCGVPSDMDTTEVGAHDFDENGGNHIFANIDWKESFLQPRSGHKPGESSKEGTEQNTLQLFPDLKVTVVKELVSTGGAVSVEDIAQYGGNHLTPEEFHEKLLLSNNTGNNNEKEVVVIDVRNIFEHDIGHFVNPVTQQPAMNPEMATFSSFESQFCQQHASELQDKTVLLYCTGGIRCEKASVMLKKRGVNDVYQLNGGIHRYLETYGEDGFFNGKNFVFDHRVALTPLEQYQQHKLPLEQQLRAENKNPGSSSHVVVGRCVECQDPFDEISGSRLCTVCRDLVLVCPTCQTKLSEYHCRRHAYWKDCYFTFLDAFTGDQLNYQKDRLEQILQEQNPSKNVRQTIRRQVEKIQKRLEEVMAHPDLVNLDAPRRCRSCMRPGSVCNGLCWGFWKTTPGAFKKPKSSI